MDLNMQCITVWCLLQYFNLAICHQRCYNGGTCTSPDVCTCANGWGGDDCTRGIDKCIVDCTGVCLLL